MRDMEEPVRSPIAQRSQVVAADCTGASQLLLTKGEWFDG